MHDGECPEMAAMTSTRKILIVDDDAELRDGLVERLALHEEFESIAVDSGSKGVQAAKAGQVDLVIMDVGLPDVDGREAVRILRKKGFKAPILMLTGHNTDPIPSSGSNPALTTTSPSRFASRCCSRASVLNFASTKQAPPPCSRSGHTRSGPARRSCSTRRAFRFRCSAAPTR